MNGSDQADLWEKSERCPPPQYSAIFSPFHLTFGQGSHLFHPEFWPGAL